MQHFCIQMELIGKHIILYLSIDLSMIHFFFQFVYIYSWIIYFSIRMFYPCLINVERC